MLQAYNVMPGTGVLYTACSLIRLEQWQHVLLTHPCLFKTIFIYVYKDCGALKRGNFRRHILYLKLTNLKETVTQNDGKHA